MKVNGLCKCCVISALLVLVSWLGATQVFSGVGGGSGSPITPYARDQQPEVKTIRSFKEQASKKRVIFKIGTEYLFIKYVGLAYVKNEEVKGDVRYAFCGFDKKGGKIEVDFSEVKDFTLLEKDGDFLVTEVTIFPAISPEELVSKQPSYQELEGNYTKSVKIRISPRDENGNILQILKIINEKKPQIILPIEKIEFGQKVSFEWDLSGDRRSFWWAIPSVIDDPLYPYRLKFKH